MKSYIYRDREFKIIPQDVSGATKCLVTDTSPDYFEVKLMSEEKYKLGEPVELFSITPQGLLYFKSDVKDLEDKNIKISYPDEYKFLQRREYTRIDMSKNIFLTSKGKDIKAKIIDISAGGMKITADSQLSLKEDYKIDLNIEKNTVINASFQPIRIDVDNLCGYTVSGRFKNIKNIDRISLVQFCFKKQLENKNK